MDSMDRDKNLQDVESEREDYAVKGSRKMNIISYIICVIAAIVIWLIIMNVTDSAEALGSQWPLRETEGVTVYDDEA